MDLFKKLRLNTDKALWLINAPAACISYFGGVTLKQNPGKEKPIDQVILFATNSGELDYYIPKLAEYIGHDTLFWICYPKKSGSIQSDLILMKA